MSCLNPTPAWQDLSVTKNGKHPVIFSVKALNPAYYFRLMTDEEDGRPRIVSKRYLPLSLPCGKCLLCRKSRAWEITIRALCEAKAHSELPNSFITLTVDDKFVDNVFPHRLLTHRPWQLFAKRLRKKIGPFRYLMCGEYGERSKRPHYHAIIFGHDLRDHRSYVAPSMGSSSPVVHHAFGVWNADGSRCDSTLVRDCWSFGHIMCRPCNDNAIAYVAGYQLKLDNLSLSSEDEDYSKSPDVKLNNYVRWSRRPGLGYDYLLKFDVFRKSREMLGDGTMIDGISPSVIYNGHEVFFDGRYFKRLLEKSHDEWSDPDLFRTKTTPLQWSALYDTISASNEGRVFMRQLHDTYYARKVKVSKLTNRADLLAYRLATKSRDLSASLPVVA